MREVAERAILENIKKRLLSDDAIRYIMEQVETAIRELERQPGDLGPFVALEHRGGSEDPWLCVPDFGQICLFPIATFGSIEQPVNSGMYLNLSQSKTVY